MKTITGLIDRNSAAIDVHPTDALDFRVRSSRCTQFASSYAAGIAVHAAMRRLGDRAVLTERERAVWPFLSAFRKALRSLGVEQIEVECPLEAWAELPHGRADVVVRGGPEGARRGLIEVKVVSTLPDSPRASDVLQCGAYVRLAARGDRFEHWWAAVAYVSVDRGMIRMFVYHSVRELALQAGQTLAA